MARRDPRRGLRYAIVLDFEATCDGDTPPDPQEIIEFPSVLLALETMRIVDTFEAFVRPHHHPTLTPFCTALTSIRQDQVDGARGFKEVMEAHHAWLTGHGITADNGLIVTCGDWDLAAMLPAQCPVAVPPVEHIPAIYARWLNVKVAFRQAVGGGRSMGMAGMLRRLGIPLMGHHHRGIDDCHNITRLLVKLLESGAIFEPSNQLPPSRQPPISLVLRRGEDSRSVRLLSRNMTTLKRLAGATFRAPVAGLRRPGGKRLVHDGELLELVPGETLEVL